MAYEEILTESTGILNPEQKSTGQVLTYNGTNWTAQDISAFPTQAVAGDAMVYNGTTWAKQSGYGYNAETNVVTDQALTFVQDGSLLFAENQTSALPSAITAVGENFTIVWDNTTYNIIVDLLDDYLVFGNKHIVEPDLPNTNEPFFYDTNGDVWVTPLGLNHTVSATKNSIVKIDTKYIPGYEPSSDDSLFIDMAYEVGLIEPSAKDGYVLFTDANNKIYVR